MTECLARRQADGSWGCLRCKRTWPGDDDGQRDEWCEGMHSDWKPYAEGSAEEAAIAREAGDLAALQRQQDINVGYEYPDAKDLEPPKYEPLEPLSLVDYAVQVRGFTLTTGQRLILETLEKGFKVGHTFRRGS